MRVLQTSHSNLKHTLTLNKKEIGVLAFKSSFSMGATITWENNVLNMERKSIFSNTTWIRNKHDMVGSVKSSWNSIKLNLKDIGHYTLKSKGFFALTYILYNSNNQIILTIKPTYSWKQWNYTYKIELGNALEDSHISFVSLVGLYATILNIRASHSTF